MLRELEKEYLNNADVKINDSKDTIKILINKLSKKNIDVNSLVGSLEVTRILGLMQAFLINYPIFN